ncbi:hypothetical protein GCM10027059_26770 [Myceligenerans halotolerans]
MTYYHGGVPGLRPRDLITPREADDASHLVDGCPTCEARRAGSQLATDPNDPRFVYVTQERQYARVYAAGYPRGALYRVEPVGELVATTDDPVPSWAVPAARVLSVLDPLVIMRPAEVRRALRRFVEGA